MKHWVKATAPGARCFDKTFGNMSATASRPCSVLGPKLERRPVCTRARCGEATQFYRQLSRYSSAFALCADMALLTLGGALKRKEMLRPGSAIFLSELYLLSAALKRWQDEGRQRADFAALRMGMASGFRTIENRFAEILATCRTGSWR